MLLQLLRDMLRDKAQGLVGSFAAR